MFDFTAFSSPLIGGGYDSGLPPQSGQLVGQPDGGAHNATVAEILGLAPSVGHFENGAIGFHCQGENVAGHFMECLAQSHAVEAALEMLANLLENSGHGECLSGLPSLSGGFHGGMAGVESTFGNFFEAVSIGG